MMTPDEQIDAGEWRAAEARIKELEGKLDKRSWQPIATAPKGERVIVAKIAESGSMDYGGAIPPHVWFAVTATHNGRYWTDGVERLVEPTHWMELPEVPQ